MNMPCCTQNTQLQNTHWHHTQRHSHPCTLSQKSMPMRQGGYEKRRATESEREKWKRRSCCETGNGNSSQFWIPSLPLCSYIWALKEQMAQVTIKTGKESENQREDERSQKPIAFAMTLDCKWWEGTSEGKTENMVHADRRKPQPVEVISGHRLFCWLFYSIILEHIYSIPECPSVHGTCHHACWAAGTVWGGGMGWKGVIILHCIFSIHA